MALFLHQIAWDNRWVRPKVMLKGGGMPPYTSNTMNLLVPRRSVSKQKWLELLESRRTAIGGYFKSTTLMRLGDVVCLRSFVDGSFKEMTLGSSGTLRSTSGFDGNATQGIFGMPKDLGFENNSIGTIVIWGLTRDGHWVIASVDYVERHGKGNIPDHVAIHLLIEKVELAQMLKRANVRPFEVWMDIENAIMRSAQQTQLRADTLRNLASNLNGETAAVLAMSRGTAE